MVTVAFVAMIEVHSVVGAAGFNRDPGQDGLLDFKADYRERRSIDRVVSNK